MVTFCTIITVNLSQLNLNRSRMMDAVEMLRNIYDDPQPRAS